MHRRARHLNPKDAGASSALDPRYLSGLSDGSGIATWTSRTGTNSPTQSTAVNQPLYKVNIQGGCPAVLCDNSASTKGRFLLYATSPISGASAVTVIYSYNRTANGSGCVVTGFGNNFLSDHDPYTTAPSGSDGALSTGSTTRHYFTSSAQNSNSINSIISQTNSWIIYINNVQKLSDTANTVGIGVYPKIGANNIQRPDGTGDGAIYYFNGYIFSVQVFPSALASSLRKRLEHAIAFSYKFATN